MKPPTVPDGNDDSYVKAAFYAGTAARSRHLEERPRPLGEIAPAAARDHVPVHDGRPVHELAPGELDVGRERTGKSGRAPAAEQPERGGHLRPVAERADRLVLREEVLDDPPTSGSTRMNSGARPPGITTAAKLRRIDVRERDSTGHVRPGLST